MGLRAAIDQIESSVVPLMERHGIPGASVALAGGGQVVWARGFGVKSTASREPVTAATVFEGASLSKPLFAYHVLHLCQTGKLNLDTPLWQYFHYADLARERHAKTVTARQVLSHQTGLPNWRPWQGPFAFMHKPGERFTYSGEAYVFLQMAIERISEMPLGEIMRRTLAPSFGMTASSYVWRDGFEAEIAGGHDTSGSPLEARRPNRGNAAWSLLTTAPDYARFVAALLDPTHAKLMRSWLRESFTPQTPVEAGISWGLGWGLSSSAAGDSFWHWGSNAGYRCFVAASHTMGNGVVVMTNSDNGMALCREVVQMTLGYDHPAFAWSHLMGDMP